MELSLLVDIGSTYTKASVIDLSELTLVDQTKTLTTVQQGVMLGVKKLIDNLEKQDLKLVDIEHSLACSSAAGGLNMVAVGLVPELTAEAAKRAALGAGAKVSKVYSYQLSEAELAEIVSLEADIILLSGGTDGGNQEVIVKNAEMIANSELETPVIIAGNKVVAKKISHIFSAVGQDNYLTENVMPELERLNIKPARNLIRKLFLEQIIYAKGLAEVEANFAPVLMPTPAAVMSAAELIAKGTEKEKGLDELLILDLGGATTDIHSAAHGKPTKNGVSLKGLTEPYLKRTVEGDLGIRYNALSIVEQADKSQLLDDLEQHENKEKLFNYAAKIRKQPSYLPNESEKDLESALARLAINLAIKRHVGRLEVKYTPVGEKYIQRGKDLSDLELVIGTGGFLTQNEKAKTVIDKALNQMGEFDILAPQEPNILIDQHYILATVGLLAEIDTDKAVRFAKKELPIDN